LGVVGFRLGARRTGGFSLGEREVVRPAVPAEEAVAGPTLGFRNGGRLLNCEVTGPPDETPGKGSENQAFAG